MMLYSLYYMSLYTFAAMKAAKDRAVGKAGEMMMNDIDGVLRFAKDNRDAVSTGGRARPMPSTRWRARTSSPATSMATACSHPGATASRSTAASRAGDVAYVQLFLVSPKNVKNSGARRGGAEPLLQRGLPARLCRDRRAPFEHSGDRAGAGPEGQDLGDGLSRHGCRVRSASVLPVRRLLQAPGQDQDHLGGSRRGRVRGVPAKFCPLPRLAPVS